MGAQFEAEAALDSAAIMHTYARKPVLFVRGEGMRLFDDDGREYLDFVSGIGAVNLGHAHPAVTAALAEQAAKLVHVSNLFYVEHRAELAHEVSELLGGGWKMFFANSGAEASEGAIKLARRWATEHKPGAYKVVTLERSFHGRTLAALAATGQASKQDAFKPLPEGFIHVPANDIEALEAVVDDTVAAVMIEIVQGEGGVWPLSAEYLSAARRVCDEAGALLMADEVQTGFYRTGPAFAHQAFGVVPDVVTVAKGLGNGLPIGGFLRAVQLPRHCYPASTARLSAADRPSARRLAPTIAELARQHLGENAVEVGAYLREGLSGVAERTGVISDIRGAGLMVGVSLISPVASQVVDLALGARPSLEPHRRKYLAFSSAFGVHEARD